MAFFRKKLFRIVFLRIGKRNFHVSPEGGDVLPATILKIGGGAESKTEVIDIGPVIIVMDGSKAFFRIITDFIALHPHLFSPLQRQLIHLQEFLFSREGELPFFLQTVESCAGFHNQIINGEVLRTEQTDVFQTAPI